MSHIPYTICRSGTYYYNRRVPKHAVKAYGYFVRHALSIVLRKLKLMQDVLVKCWKGLGVGQ